MVMSAITLVLTSIPSRTRYGQVWTLSGTSLEGRSATAAFALALVVAAGATAVVASAMVVDPPCGKVHADRAKVEGARRAHRGPEIPPSLRTRQKCTIINTAAMMGMKMQ